MEAGANPERSRHCDRLFSTESQTLSATKHVKRGRDIPKEFDMTASTFAPTAARPAAIPIRELLPWVIFAGLLCLIGVAHG